MLEFEKKEAERRLNEVETMLESQKKSRISSSANLSKWKTIQNKNSGESGQSKSSPLSTPIQDVTRTFDKLSKVSGLVSSVDMQNILKGVLDAITAQNLHVPSPAMFKQLNLDDMTMNYIMSYSQSAQEPQELPPGERVQFQDYSDTKIVELHADFNLELLQSLDFCSWKWSREDQAKMVVLIYESVGLLERFKISPDTLLGFVTALQESYLDNPYHNFSHAFDVFQMCFVFVSRSKTLQGFLRKIDLLCLFTAALCHGNFFSFAKLTSHRSVSPWFGQWVSD